MFNGKKSLLKKLPERFSGYRSWISEQNLIIVVVDRDRDNCIHLKKQIQDAATRVGLTSCSVSRSTSGQVLTIIAIEELEAWFIGDVPALRAAYDRIPKSLENRRKFREPDAITGGTAEALERLLKEYGYHRGGLAKGKLAETVAPHMSLSNNRSPSFKYFVESLKLTESGF